MKNNVDICQVNYIIMQIKYELEQCKSFRNSNYNFFCHFNFSSKKYIHESYKFKYKVHVFQNQMNLVFNKKSNNSTEGKKILNKTIHTVKVIISGPPIEGLFPEGK